MLCYGHDRLGTSVVGQPCPCCAMVMTDSGPQSWDSPAHATHMVMTDSGPQSWDSPAHAMHMVMTDSGPQSWESPALYAYGHDTLDQVCHGPSMKEC